MSLSIESHPSPNSAPRTQPIDMIVLHYTGMTDAVSALSRLCDPASEVSAHYLVGEDGRILQLVDDQHRAWHAGRSYWRGAAMLNDRSLGIELVNPGHEHGYRPFPEAQMLALEALLRQLVARWRIDPARVLGHSDIAPARKEDPGELFPWGRLWRGSALGLWPHAFAADRHVAVPKAAMLAEQIRAIGYDPEASDAALIAAFRRHFRPRRLAAALVERADAALAAATLRAAGGPAPDTLFAPIPL